jgi:hypothetical protein
MERPSVKSNQNQNHVNENGKDRLAHPDSGNQASSNPDGIPNKFRQNEVVMEEVDAK